MLPAKSVDVFVKAGKLALKQRKVETAVDAFLRALAVAPKNRVVVELLATALCKQNREADAAVYCCYLTALLNLTKGCFSEELKLK